MSKRSKSKRFSHQGATAVKKHDEIFTYRSTLAQAKGKHQDADDQSLGGF
ncbi:MULTISPECIES: hypothetical protein [Oceanobacillus]|uniref:Competence protein n=1 Tax=Oceanobacillus kimchii TaxID=746691 RepID=A0ABQ5THZ0_9BACI|nr:MULTISPECIES: hypothetical protein [Oceanobacillus]MBT2599048.1 hypothetical protein [Oceanobacillus sp. ISL-74]MBT2651966.1 hypothetical protein [Oceanobacillus sp. ISL-73]MCT1578697.1 hypothetical protein [Oceanobacillus kimchii]MCT2136254.1 hypothetical protein [Oceanobacillus kimchii]GLO65640.1 hypothetical protein MACH08_14240 [Oceanobacillus kimchii]